MDPRAWGAGARSSFLHTVLALTSGRTPQNGGEDVPADIVSRERDIQMARAKESGKPAEIAAKMVEGAVNKFLGEITLMGQPFVKDDKQTVEKMLGAKKAKVNAYAFFVVGEGIEKKSSDFAAEVMAQAGKAH